MTEREKMLAGLQYDCGDPEVLDRWHLARALTLRYKQTDSRDSRAQLLSQLLGGMGENLWITLPFYVDYGNNIYFAENCEVNLNCTFQDCNRIIIGKNALIGPNVQIYTAFHPTNAADRLARPAQAGLPLPLVTPLPSPSATMCGWAAAQSCCPALPSAAMW